MLPADPSLSVAERVDAACDRFESEWKSGGRPKIDDYVSAAPETDREELQRALLALEAELQGSADEDAPVTRSGERAEGKLTHLITVDQVDNTAPPAKKIGRFELRTVLGSGAFGKVYRAFDPQLGREVALKVPLASTVSSEKERAQFLKEARSAATINHPNVCQVHEVGEADGRPYIVMALVRGKSLADMLKARKEPLPEKQAALVVRKIALALATAHASGVIHRDLKPANVMFDRERKDIIVMDFGLARGPRLGDARGTKSGVIMGTPSYMSPEQARGDSKGVGPAADIFSLGVILYELLTGTRPFTGTATEVIAKILHIEPEKPSTVRPDIDPRLESICLKAMAKDQSVRFGSMKEFAAALDAVLRKPAPAGPAVETARANTTRHDGDDESNSTRNDFAEVFAALSDDLKQARVETAAAVEAAIAKHRTPRWIVLLIGLFFAGGLMALTGVIFFTRSDKVKVDLAVIINDVDLKDSSLSFFLDDEPVPADALAKPVELKPGVHIFTVKRDQEIVKRVEIRVAGGGKPGTKVEDITPGSRLVLASDDLARWQGTWRCIDGSQGEKYYSPEQLKYGAHYQFMSGNGRLLQLPAFDNRVNRWGGTIQLSANGHFDCDDFRYEAGKVTYRQSGHYEFVGDNLRVIYRFGLAGRPIERARWSDRGQDHVIYFEYRKLTPEDDIALWQGRWRCEGEKSLGGAWTPEQLQAAGKVMEVKNNRLVIERTIDGRFGRYTGTFKLNPAASPKEFDWEGTGPRGAKIRLQGVYEFAGDRLRFIYRSTPIESPPIRAGWADELQSGVWVEFVRVGMGDGFVPLFNGKDLTGWTLESGDQDNWTVRDGVLVASTPADNPYQTWLLSDKEYGNCVVRYEFKALSEDAESGFALRALPGERQPGEVGMGTSMKPTHFQIKICGSGNTQDGVATQTGMVQGTINTHLAPNAVIPSNARGKQKPDGEWNFMEVEIREQKLLVRLNGEVVVDGNLDDLIARGSKAPALLRRGGRIGFSRRRGTVQFRNILIMELDDGSVPPSYGKD